MQGFGAIVGQCETHQAARVLGHEVDDFRGRHLRRDDDVALILTLFGVDEDEHAAVARIFDDILGAREKAVKFTLHANSLSRAK